MKDRTYHQFMARGNSALTTGQGPCSRSHSLPYVDAGVDLTKITPAGIRLFLQERSFEMVDDSKQGQTWISEDESLPAVLVPHERYKELQGYEELLGSAVIRLSWICDRSQADVCAELLEKVPSKEHAHLQELD